MAAQPTEIRESALTLKAMRLIKPSFELSRRLPTEKGEIFGLNYSIQEDKNPSASSAFFALGDTLALPGSMGSVHVGEVFRSYISVRNTSNFVLSEIIMRVELHAAVSKHVLCDNSSNPIHSSSQGQSHDFIVHKDIEEEGTYQLFCIASYIKPDGERQVFRKCFKFQVNKPFETFFRSQNIQNDVILEAQVRSSLPVPVYIQSVRFLSSNQFFSFDFNSEKPSATPAALSPESAFIQPGSILNFMYKLTPKEESKQKVLGNLVIEWSTSLGENGKYTSEQVTRELPNTKEVDIVLQGVPSEISLESPFTTQCEVINKMDKPLNAKLLLVKSKMSGIMINGFSGQNLGQIPPNGSKSVNLTLFPIQPGVQKISGIQIVEIGSDRKFDFDNFLDVFVESHIYRQ